MLTFAVLLAAAALPATAPAQQHRYHSVSAGLDSIAQGVFREYPNAGLSLAVLRGGNSRRAPNPERRPTSLRTVTKGTLAFQPCC